MSIMYPRNTIRREKACTCTLMLCSLIVVVIACVETGSAFVQMRTAHHRPKQMAFLIRTPDNIRLSRSRLHESAAKNDETASSEQYTDIETMRVSEMKQELQRLNVSSKDCFDRESLVERLLRARQNPQPQSSPQESEPKQSPSSESESSTTVTATATTSTDETESSSTTTNGTTATTDTQSPQELRKEVAALSVRDLRIELASSGIRWAGMLEKRDLVDAVVKCRIETAKFSVTGRMHPGQVADLTAEDLTQELQSKSTLVLLDVYATWCGPCQMMVPHLQRTAAALGSRVRVGKMDSDKYPQAAGQYKVQGLPTVLLLRGDEVIDRVEGMLTQEQLMPWVERHL